jgi:hypothetical protein
MLLTEQPWSASVASNGSATRFELRAYGGSDQERLIAIPWGKLSVGSGPRCSLRFEEGGVGPLECLLVHDRAGLRVRRWSDSVRVNGEPFDDVPLGPGDVIAIGPLELEVVAADFERPATDGYSAFDPGAEIERLAKKLAAETSIADDFEADMPPGERADTRTPRHNDVSTDWDAANWAEARQCSMLPNLDQSATAERLNRSIVRRRSRRLLGELRRQRHAHAELMGRLESLERTVTQVLAEPPRTQRIVRESPASAEMQAALAQQTAEAQRLAAELGTVREQLAARDAEMGQARYSIDVLERQLIDSQRTMHAFAGERVTWQEQCDELEARLAKYVEQINVLERQLDQVRATQQSAEPAPDSAAIDTSHADASAALVESVDTAGAAAEPPHDALESASTVTESASEETPEEGVGQVQAVEASTSQMATAAVSQDVAEASAAGADEITVAEDGGEVDAALDHLRGLSLWREEPEIAAEDAEPQPLPEPSDEANGPKSPEPESFIDRYAHLFPAEDSASEPPAPAPSRVVAPAASTHGSLHSDSHSDSHAEEESVEQYMARLLERMRGPASKSDSVDEATAENAAQEPLPDATPQLTAAAETPVVQEPITELEELKSGVAAPERASDMAAMRALANQSARHAIGIHTARKLRRSARTRLIIAVLGAAVGLYLLLVAPSWKSLQFAAGCVAAFASIYWGKLLLGTLIEGIRLGAFEDFDEEVDPHRALHPPLPIDVERAADAELTPNGEQPAGGRPEGERRIAAAPEGWQSV